ncbi:UNKNOWN [Stylonychia lemnae]|uniref:Uncharacterized protein n=1 Tax=Stylonychia lemnae TaxID=5949 RepID=A0A078AY84_STYLE|nr:UNKNOWN [Stylonychia lemnae]|eukprot:CDW87124.1 UNKNOWN [Stylonychia lemnae]
MKVYSQLVKRLASQNHYSKFVTAHNLCFSSENNPKSSMTKEQMKKDLMEGSHFETELLRRKKVVTTPTDEEIKKQEELEQEAAAQALSEIYDEQQVKEVLDKIKESGVTEYKIFEIQPEALKKIQFYKNILFFVNIPMILGIPALTELGFLDHKPNAKTIFAILHLTDFFLCFNSIIIYSTLQRLVSAIYYMPQENKILVKQWSAKLLGLKDLTFDPKDLIRIRKQSFNPFIGYKSVHDNNVKLGTESIGLWHDRKLFDSMIFREVKRRVVRPIRKGPVSSGVQTGSQQKSEDKKE